jgi:hypothetical protein
MASSAPYARRSFAGGAVATTIPTGMGSSDTSFTLAASTGWSFANDFFVVVDRGLSSEEKIECTGIAGLVVSVAVRGADDTSAQAHVAGCTVQVCHVAQDDDEANQVVSAVLGQSGAAKGDILYMLSASGPNTLSRLGIGTSAQVLGVSAGVPVWGGLTAAQLETAFTAKGQLLVGTGSGTGDLVATGTSGQVLTVGGSDGSGLEWTTPGGAPGTTVESYIGSPINGTGSAQNITSVSLGAGTWLIIGSVTFADAAVSIENTNIWIGPTTGSSVSAYQETQTLTGEATGGIQYSNQKLIKSVTLATTTIIYLGTQAASTVTIVSGPVNATGITAVRTA